MGISPWLRPIPSRPAGQNRGLNKLLNGNCQYHRRECWWRVRSPVKLLLVEDDPMLAETICDGIRQQGWAIDHVRDALAAKLALVEHGYATVLLDLGLPGESGLSVLKKLRERYDATPVLILTARGQLSDRIRGLDAGADDYLVKPFPFDELLARVRAVIRRSQGRVVPAMTCGDVVLDPAKRLVTRRGERVSLSAHEYRTLLTLMERPGHVVTREHLENAVYGNASSIESNTIAVFIHQLRRKLGDDIITTVHGQGYMIGGARS
jgi:two-component system OmpR family response regulator